MKMIKINMNGESMDSTNEINEMTDKQIKDSIKGTFITDNNGVFKYISDDAIEYVNEYLLNCETHQDDLLVNVKGYMEDIEIVDVIGIIEEKGRIFVGLEIEYDEYCYLININFINAWDFVYKDEMIEIQDVISRLISEQLKTDLGLKDNILDDVKQWLKESVEPDDTKENILNDVVTYGVENVAPNHLIYNCDIMNFYNEHYLEINEILEKYNKKNLETINAVWYAWEKVAYEYLETLRNK